MSFENSQPGMIEKNTINLLFSKQLLTNVCGLEIGKMRKKLQKLVIYPKTFIKFYLTLNLNFSLHLFKIHPQNIKF